MWRRRRGGGGGGGSNAGAVVLSVCLRQGYAFCHPFPLPLKDRIWTEGMREGRMGKKTDGIESDRAEEVGEGGAEIKLNAN
ncbi:hypothetical protein J4Q44_G00256820 [Coregonus suidteri]|uniref:Uncharacterized protein n=1 Tax=Coregonus suidteri TaxID=861788 RepID=A0AAN8QMD4_9TELE